MNISRASRSGLAIIAAALVATGAAAQAIDFDSRPTGFLSAQTGGMPADAWILWDAKAGWPSRLQVPQ